jgi:SAM-dependent methyltransferase
MTKPPGGEETRPAPGAGGGAGAAEYKRDFWDRENLKFSEPWYRLRKAAQLIGKLAGGRDGALLDVGCGPGALAQLLPPGIRYYGIDLAIHDPAPNLIEADLVQSPIRFGDMTFDIVTALGLFEYLGTAQARKLSEIAGILNNNGRFIVSYTNFGHRKTRMYEAFSNIQPLGDFRRDLERCFRIDRSFPASHNWKHSQPDREVVKTVNMRFSANIPILSPRLAVDYFFVCSPR